MGTETRTRPAVSDHSLGKLDRLSSPALSEPLVLSRAGTRSTIHPPLMFSRPAILTVLVLFFAFTFVGPNSVAQQNMNTGLEGQIRISPTHGGPVRQGVDDSKPLAKTVFIVKQHEKIVATFETDDNGRFRLALPPGKYSVSKKDWNGIGGSYGPFEVDVVGGQVKKVQWDCDSGMD